MFAPFPPYEPDSVSLFGSGQVANNVLPSGPAGRTFYTPMRALTAYSGALGGPGLGLLSVRAPDGTIKIVAGSAAKLYELNNTTKDFDDISVAANYTLNSGEYWWFMYFGAIIIAGSQGVTTQAYTVGTSTLFANLAGSPPTGRCAGIFGPFAMIGQLGTDAKAIQWCAAADATTWTTGRGANGGTQTFQDGGPIRGLAGGRRYGFILQENMIRSVQLTLDNAHFQFDIFARDVGLEAPNSLVSRGQDHFFKSGDGFYRLNTEGLIPIGRGRVDQSFRNDVDLAKISYTQGAIDPNDTKVYWAYYSSSNLTAYADKVLIYDYYRDLWAMGDGWDLSVFGSVVPLGITLDGIDALYSQYTLDTLPWSLDSSFWQGTAPSLAAFGNDDKLAFLSADALAATVDTIEIEPIPGKRSYILGARPMIIGSADSTISIGHRERLGDTVTYDAATSLIDTGDCPQGTSGRYHRARWSAPAASTWTEALGVDHEAIPDGMI